MAQTKPTPNPPPSINYQSLYRWALDSLFAETSQIKTFKDVDVYKEGESDEKFRIFGREHDRFVKVRPCRDGEHVCLDDRADPKEPFFFMYSTIFKRLKLRLPFVRAFAILYNHFGHTPSMYIFLYFFEAKNPGKKLRMSFNGVAGRVLLTISTTLQGLQEEVLQDWVQHV